MLQKRYARKAENKQVGKVWYIPHHGVTHPAKPGKVQVVFDCSGLRFLWKSESEWPTQVSVDVDDNDPEVKAALIVNLAATEFDLLSKLEAKFSSWLKLRKAVALIPQLKQILLMQVRLKQYTTTKAPVNMEMLQEAS